MHVHQTREAHRCFRIACSLLQLLFIYERSWVVRMWNNKRLRKLVSQILYTNKNTGWDESVQWLQAQKFFRFRPGCFCVVIKVLKRFVCGQICWIVQECSSEFYGTWGIWALNWMFSLSEWRYLFSATCRTIHGSIQKSWCVKWACPPLINH